MSTKFQRINENVFKLVPEEEIPVGNPGLENNVKQMRNAIVAIVDKMPYPQLKELYEYLASQQ